jgi:hypothetical protein
VFWIAVAAAWGTALLAEVVILDAPLPTRSRRSIRIGARARSVLRRVLLGADARDVRGWSREPGLDGRVDRGDGYEKVGRHGERLAPVVGIVLIVWALVVVAHPTWLPGMLAGGAS